MRGRPKKETTVDHQKVVATVLTRKDIDMKVEELAHRTNELDALYLTLTKAEQNLYQELI